jgi:hypothetical protein
MITSAERRPLSVLKIGMPPDGLCQRYVKLKGRETMSASNAAMVRKAYEDFAQGNVSAVFAALTRLSLGTFQVITRAQAT